jgi:hypothetical protein
MPCDAYISALRVAERGHDVFDHKVVAATNTWASDMPHAFIEELHFDILLQTRPANPVGIAPVAVPPTVIGHACIGYLRLIGIEADRARHGHVRRYAIDADVYVCECASGYM